MNRNILREHRHLVDKKFIISYTGKENNSLYYNRATIRQFVKPMPDIKRVAKISESDYEQTLINFFENPELLEGKCPILIIIGGLGSGKSSSLNFAIENAKICEGCELYDNCSHNLPQRIKVDFIDFRTTVSRNLPSSIIEFEQKDLINKFWNFIIRSFDESIDSKMDSNTEVSLFWPWLFKNHRIILPNDIYGILNHHTDLLEAPAHNSNKLYELRDEIYQKTSSKSRLYYKLIQLAYLRININVNCDFIIFDNMDSIAPYLQSELIDLSVYANKILNCKTILPLRPHTYTNHKDGANFMEQLPHMKSRLEEVFNRRLEYFRDTSQNTEVYLCLKKLISLIKSRDVFRKVFVATSGKSIRFALRNFFNFSLSELVVTHENDRLNTNISMDSNTFFEAYFCHEEENNLMDESNFSNILSLKRSRNSRSFSNIKLRILHYLKINDTVTSQELVNFLFAFGYEIYSILLALNELLDNKKALLWSDCQVEYTEQELLAGTTHEFQITNLGIRYLETMLKLPLYLRECIFSVDRKRRNRKTDAVSRLMEVLKQLEEDDIEEVDCFIDKIGLHGYQNIYLPDTKSISHFIWEKLEFNFDNWISDIEGIYFESERLNSINYNLSRLKVI